MKYRHIAMSIMTAVLVVLSLAVVYFNLIDGKFVRKPLKFISDPTEIKLEKTVYRRGEEVRGYIEYCKLRNITAKRQWQLADHQLIFYPSKVSSIPKGCHSTTFTIETIPLTIMPTDQAFFEGFITYQVNPLSEVNVVMRTETFTIKP